MGDVVNTALGCLIALNNFLLYLQADPVRSNSAGAVLAGIILVVWVGYKIRTRGQEESTSVVIREPNPVTEESPAE